MNYSDNKYENMMANDVKHPHQDIALPPDLSKKPYCSPTLSIFALDQISGGIQSLQDAVSSGVILGS
jgi:hypothetical protein